jgi:septal ring factor EnvC (AmiA/AmiB activator)
MKLIAILKSLLVLSWLSACAHTSDLEQRKQTFEQHADDRLSNMNDNIKSLEKRSSQLLGEPRQQLNEAISGLKQQVANSRAELGELKGRSGSTWVEKKEQVDRQLYEMERSYNGALNVLSAH